MIEIGHISDSGSNLLATREGQESTRNAPILSHGQDLLSVTLDTDLTDEAELHSVEAERGARFSPYDFVEEESLHEESLEVGRQLNVALVGVFS